MDHKQVNELLAAYLDDEVTGAQRQEIEAHLATCQSCRQDLDALKSARDILRQALKSKAADADPPSRAWTELLPELQGQRPSFLFLFRGRKSRIIGTIIALAIILALAILWATGVLPGLR